MTHEQAERLIAAVERVAAALEAKVPRKPHDPAKRKRKIDDATLTADWTAGIEAAELAAKYAVSVATVYDNAARLGLPRRAKKIMGRTVLTPDRYQEFAADWSGGDLTRAEIAAKYRVTKAAVKEWAEKLDLPPHPNPHGDKLHGREVEFRGDWAAGLPLKEMAEKYGFGVVAQVSTRAAKMGLPSRLKSRLGEHRADERSEYEAGAAGIPTA